MEQVFASGGPAGGQPFEKFDKQFFYLIYDGLPVISAHHPFGRIS
jgi:hypothetical protein